MALPKFLLQVRKGQTSTVYRWTEALATRKDMRPITGKEAKKILDVQAAEKAAIVERQTADLFVDTEDDFSENDIVADPELDAEAVIPAQHPSFKTQETIMAEEYARIDGFKTKNELEIYILEKYQLNMIPGTRESMDEQAKAFIAELARNSKLYSKLNE